MRATAKDAFEKMAATGGGDAGAVAVGLRRGVTTVGLRALAAKAVHVAAASPERLMDVYDNAAAGWLSQPVFPPRLRLEEPLPISDRFWDAFWDLVHLPTDATHQALAAATLRAAGELDPRINARMAVAAMDYPGVVEAAAGGIPEPYDPAVMEGAPPASLGFLLRQDRLAGGDGFAAPFGGGLVALLRHMPAPLAYINVHTIQSLAVLGVVAGYGPARLDRVAFGAFLMGQTGHHYSALSTAATLTALSLARPDSVDLRLDCIFRAWAHGRETPLLLGAPWPELWNLRLDEVRQTLGVHPFASPYAEARRRMNEDPADR
ncbi:MAG: hypothetical protein JNK30_09725 [Phenylobacterium sp.]|uniref:hypothetical protein n=1 Tax=Phenylobacterium sp. TaxID=1871053 RepID=UPI001A61B91F|nr:hypothetical protein [Phenylobacterium sp.]MBL8771648.1 hypothetical protein [Phenylobacterium sp.]